MSDRMIWRDRALRGSAALIVTVTTPSSSGATTIDSDIVTFCQRVAPPRRNLCLRIAREPHRPRSDGPDARETKMTTLLMIIGFGAATSVVVGLGQRLRLPWPALMVLIGIAGAFI